MGIYTTLEHGGVLIDQGRDIKPKQETAMKGIMISLVLFTSIFFVSGVANAQASQAHECTEASLNGSYGFMLNGTIFGRGLIGGVGVVTFDGNGNLFLRGTVVFQDTGLSHPNFTGTYIVNPDCTGSLTHPMAVHDFVIVDGGKEILEIAAQSDRVVTYVLKKQSPRHDDEDEGTRQR